MGGWLVNKKGQICEAAIRLFNEEGYGKVSLREIAKAAGTTIGNLTYHFPQKEALLLNIVESLHSEFLMEDKRNIHRAELLSALLDSFLLAERNQKENSFYYRNIPMLSQDSSEIKEKNDVFQVKLFAHYTFILNTLKKDGVLKSEMDDSAIQSVACAIITLNAVWMQDIAPSNNEGLPSFRISCVLAKLLFPFISEKYTEEFSLLCREKGIF